MTDALAVNGAVNVPHHVPCEQVEQGSGHASQSFHDPMTVVTLQITFFTHIPNFLHNVCKHLSWLAATEESVSAPRILSDAFPDVEHEQCHFYGDRRWHEKAPPIKRSNA